MGEEPASVTASGTKKKKSLMKRLAKGISKKKKKKNADDESVYGVSVAGNSIVESVTGSVSNGIGSPLPNSIGPPIQIILLLMDPNSRRFELLQLEFDSTKALTSDVLLQIEQSATETTLRDMVYAGICDQDGMEMISACKLSMFCSPGSAKGNLVLAMPKGLTGEETAKLSKPILEDEKVVEMLRPCGIKLTPKPKKLTTQLSGGSALAKIEEEEKPKSVPQSTAKVATASRSAQPPPSTSREISEPKAKKKSKPSYFPTQMLGLVIAALIYFITNQHSRITRPIQSGLCLMPGEWISHCGVWEIFGSKFCDESKAPKLSMGTDGKLRYFNKSSKSGKTEEVWSVGAECDGGNDAEQCVFNLDCQGAAFTLNKNKWFVEVNGENKPLTPDVVELFT